MDKLNIHLPENNKEKNINMHGNEQHQGQKASTFSLLAKRKFT